MQSYKKIRLLLNNYDSVFCVIIVCVWRPVCQQLEWWWFGEGASPSFPHQCMQSHALSDYFPSSPPRTAVGVEGSDPLCV